MKKGQLDSHILVLVTLGLTAFGLVMVYSATSAPAALGGGDPVFYLKRESIYAAIGVVLLVLGSRMDYRTLRYLAPPLMLTSLGALLRGAPDRRAGERRAALARSRARSRSSRRSSRRSASRSGRRPTWRAGPRRRR